MSFQRKNERGVFTDVDEATIRMLGWSRDELVGRPALSLVHPDDQKRAIDVWFEMMQPQRGSSRARMRMQHADGRWLWFEVTNHQQVDDSAEPYVATEMFDIGDEMAAHEAVRTSAVLLRRIAETVPLGIFQCDEHGAPIYMNERLREILGESEDPMASIAGPDRELLVELLRAALLDGRDRDLEVRVPVDNELTRRCRASIRALVDEGSAITGAIVCVEDITESARMHAELQTRATFDALTGCFNRASILEELDAIVTRGSSVAVIFIDLDGFKLVNDEHGHAVGDAVIAEAANRIQAGVRAGDLVGRLGGDEFLVISPALRVPDDAIRVARRVCDLLAAEMRVDGVTISIRASAGVAAATEAIAVDDLVAQADRAMYISKAQGRGVPVVVGTTVSQ
jgi:diguanylate cyclase (GGDEF)-like protein/PAS domain S-box-containing protein